MNGEDRKAIQALVPYMRSIPGKIQKLVSQIVQVRKAYHGENTNLSTYKANLQRELEELENIGRNVAQVAITVKALIDDPEALEDIYSLLSAGDTYTESLMLLNEISRNKRALEEVYVFLRTFSLDE